MIRQLPAALRKRRAPRVVAIIPSYIASCQINVIKPLSALAKKGHIHFKHQTEQSTSPSAIEWADLIVYCRNTEPSFRHLLNDAIGRRKPIIYDIDDSFWDVSRSTDPDLARYHTQPSRLRQLESYLQVASLVRVYSPLLSRKVSRFNSKVRIYRSSFDFNQVPELKPVKINNGMVGIVYATSRTVDDQYKVFLPALSEFLNQHQDKVELTVWGCNPPELLTLPGVTHRKLLPNYDEFLREFSRSEFNIGLAPLQDNEFNRSKNNTKFRDYGACGVAGIYSNVDAYAASVEHGKDGLLVEDTKQDWLKALERLSFDQELQGNIRTNAREKVFQNYRQELIEAQWLEDIHGLLADAPSFWRVEADDSTTLTFNVVADKDYLSGVLLQSNPHRQVEHVSKANTGYGETSVCAQSDRLHLEVQSPSGQTLRGIASCAPGSRERVSIFNFEAIRNSQNRPFKLRITGISGKNSAQAVSHLSNSLEVRLLFDIEKNGRSD